MKELEALLRRASSLKLWEQQRTDWNAELLSAPSAHLSEFRYEHNGSSHSPAVAMKRGSDAIGFWDAGRWLTN
jgi:hypothetical protein